MSVDKITLSNEQIEILLRRVADMKVSGARYDTIFKHVAAFDLKDTGYSATQIELFYLQDIYPKVQRGDIKIEGLGPIPMPHSKAAYVPANDEMFSSDDWSAQEKTDMYEFAAKRITFYQNYHNKSLEEAKQRSFKEWQAKATKQGYPKRSSRQISNAFSSVRLTRPAEAGSQGGAEGSQVTTPVSTLSISSDAAPGLSQMKQGNFLGTKNRALLFARVGKTYSLDQAARLITDSKLGPQVDKRGRPIRISNALLGRLENNNAIATDSVARKIAAFYGVTDARQLFPMIREDHVSTAFRNLSKLSELRAMAGLTQPLLAEEVRKETGVKVTVVLIKRIENNEPLFNRNREQVRAIANYFGKSAAEICERIDTGYIEEVRAETQRTNETLTLLNKFSLQEFVEGLIDRKLAVITQKEEPKLLKEGGGKGTA